MHPYTPLSHHATSIVKFAHLQTFFPISVAQFVPIQVWLRAVGFLSQVLRLTNREGLGSLPAVSGILLVVL